MGHRFTFELEILEARVLLSNTPIVPADQSTVGSLTPPEVIVEEPVAPPSPVTRAASTDAASDLFAGMASAPLMANPSAGTPGIGLSSSPGQWEEQGPGPIADAQVAGIPDGTVSGAVQAIAVDPHDINVIYAGTVNGGIWKTTNGAAANPHWEPLTDNQPAGSISAIVLSPLDSKLVYAGTGRVSSAGGQGRTAGLLMSTDAGSTWVQVGSSVFAGLSVTSVVPAALNRNLVFVATTLDEGAHLPGVYSSKDGGATWTRLSGRGGAGALPAGNVTDLVEDPGNANRLYAALPGSGIYRSDDGGGTWKKVDTGMSDLARSTRIRLAVSGASVSPGGADSVYAGVIAPADLHLSANAGVGTRVLNIQDDAFWQTNIALGQDIYIQTPTVVTALAANAAAGTTLLKLGDVTGLQADDVLVFRGTLAEVAVVQAVNAGAKTVQLADPLAHAHSAAEEIDRFFQTNTVVAVDPETNTLALGRRLTAAHTSGQVVRLTTGSVVTGLFWSSDAGEHWAALPQPTTRDTVLSDFNGNGFYSEDEFHTHTYGLSPGAQADIHFSVAADPNDPRVVYVGGDRQPVTDAFDWNGNGSTLDITSFSDGRSFPERGNAAGLTNWVGRIFRGDTSRPAGTVWEQIVGNGAHGTAPHADSRTIVINATGNLLEGDDGGVFRLSAPGSAADRQWASKNGDLRISEIYSVAYDPVNDVILEGSQDTGSAEQKAGFQWQTIAQGDGSVQGVAVLGSGTVVRYSLGNDWASFDRRTFDAQNARIGDSSQVLLKPAWGGDPLEGLNEPDRNRGGVFALNTVDPRRVLIGAGALYESVQDSQGDIIRSVGPVVNQEVTALVYGGFNPDGSRNPGVIYVARGGQIRVRAGDDAPLLKTAGNGLKEAWIADLVLDPKDWHIAYAISPAHIYMTTDAGQNWIDITGSLTGVVDTFRTIEIIQTAAGKVLLAGAFGQVYQALNPGKGAVWSAAGIGFPNVQVTDLHYDPTDDILVAGTLGRGVWSMSGARSKLTPNVLVVQGDTKPGSPNDVVRLVLDPGNPLLLDVFLNNSGPTPDFSVRLASLAGITVKAGSGDDHLTIDSSNGMISAGVLSFDGEVGTNTLTFQGAPGDTVLIETSTGPNSGVVLLSGGGAFESASYMNAGVVEKSLPPPNPGLLQRLSDGLLHLVESSSAWAQPEFLGTTLPVLRGSLGRALSGGSITPPSHIVDPAPGPAEIDALPPAAERHGSGQLLRELLENEGLLLDDIGTAITTPEALRDRLDQLDDTPGNVSMTDSNGVLRYELTVTKTLSGLGDFDVELVGDAIELHGTWTLRADVTLHLVIGVDGQGFFVETQTGGPELTIRNIRAAGEVHVDGGLGFLGVSLQGATLATAPGVVIGLDLSDPGTGSRDGRLRVDETREDLASWVKVTVQGDAGADDVVLSGTFAAAPVLPGLEEPINLGKAELTFTWKDISDLASVELQAANQPGDDLLHFRNATLDQWLTGLDQFTSFLDTLGGVPVLRQALPWVGRTAGQLLNWTGRLHDALKDLKDLLPTGPEGATLQNAAAGLLHRLGMDPGAVGIQYDPAAQTVSYRVTLHEEPSALQFPLNFDVHAATLGSFTTSGQVRVQPSLSLAFRFGADLGVKVEDSSLADRFFVSDVTAGGRLALSASDITAAARLGPLSVDLNEGALSAQATVSVGLKAPAPSAAGAKLSLRELAGAAGNPESVLDNPSLEVSGSFAFKAAAAPIDIGGLRVVLSGEISGTESSIDYSLTAAVSGTFLNTLTILPQTSGAPSTVTYTKASGFTLAARARTFDVTVTLEGAFPAPGDFNLHAVADPIRVAGVTVNLSGSAFSNDAGSGYVLTAEVSQWQPVSFVTVNALTVTLDGAGVRFKANARIAGVDGVALEGDYDFGSDSYALAAVAPVSWTLVSGVNLSNVTFTLSNRTPGGTAGDTRVGARAHLRLFGTDFDVSAHVTGSGAWAAAVPLGPLVLVPGLSIQDPVVIVSSYDFVIDTATREEVPGLSAPQNASQQKISTGVDLMASATLPETVPGFGGSTAQISGVLGTDLSQMALEARLALTNPPEIAGLLALDSVGLRITGDFTLTVFGDGRILHGGIPGLGEDIAVRAGLTLDLVHTTLKGSLSLLHPLNSVFGVTGLNILEGDGTFGLNFLTTPLPLPTVGFNFVVELPTFAQTLLALPPKLAAAMNVSSTEPILAMTVEHWQPLSKLGVNDLTVQQGTIVVAPNGGSIGLKTFPRGFSAAFVANLFGTDVQFLGRFDQQNQGISLEAYVSSFTVAGLNITGAGPDRQYGDGKTTGGAGDVDNDNGAYFKADLTPQKQVLAFSGRLNLPGQGTDGSAAFAQLEGALDANGLKLAGEVEHWQVLPLVLQIDTARFAAEVPLASPLSASLSFSGDMLLLQTPVQIQGSFSSKGISLTGTLKNPGNFAGLSVGGFTLAFSTVQGDEHFLVQFTVDLLGTGGETIVQGLFQDRQLILNASVSHWQPIPALDFNGTLRAALPLDAGSLSLDFDLTTTILGASARFTGSVSTAPGGFRLFATSTIALRLPGGQKVADLQGTIDLQQNSTFEIGLAGDFTLPGTQSADVRLEGSIGASGIRIFGAVNGWELVPGLSFDGFLKVRFPTSAGGGSHGAGAGLGGIGGIGDVPHRIPVLVDSPVFSDPLPSSTSSLSLELDVSASLLGSNLRLVGKLNGNGTGFDLDLTGHVRLSGPLVAGVVLDLDASLLTTQPALGPKQYRLRFTGDLKIFADFAAVQIAATMQGDASGNWALTVQGGVQFNVSTTIDDIIGLDLNARIEGTLTLRSDAGLSFGLSVSGSAHAKVPKLGLDSSVGLNIGIKADVGAGTATIPNARPKVDHNQAGIPTGISWHDYVLNTAEPAAPLPTVTATFVPAAIRGRPGTVQVRGTNAPEAVSIALARPILGSDEDLLVVRAATGSGPLVTLLSVAVSSVGNLDVDLSGGNDTVSLDLSPKGLNSVLRLRTVIRGGLGSDTISVAGNSPVTIYGNRENASDDAFDDGDVVTSSAPGTVVFGGGGNDTITATGVNASIDGGDGSNIINGTLLIRGSAGGDHISVRAVNGSFTFKNPFGPSAPVALVVQSWVEQGPLVTVDRVAPSSVTRLQVDGLTGDDTITVAPEVALPAVLNGGPGDDTIQAGAGSATIHGDDGNDILRGGTGANALFGDAGDDTLFAGPGTNALDGGVGRNTVHTTGQAAVQAQTGDVILTDGGQAVLSGGNVAVLAATLNDGASQRSRVTAISLRFNRDVSASLGEDDLRLTAANGTVVPTASLVIAWDKPTNTAAITFRNLPGNALPDGEYTLRFDAAAVTDASGNPLADEFVLSFTALSGDVTGDGAVNDLDLLGVWRELRKPADARDPNADANGDGHVDGADLALVRQQFGTRLTPVPP